MITPLRTRSRWECSGYRARATDASGESHGKPSTVRKILSAVSFAQSDQSHHSKTNGFGALPSCFQSGPKMCEKRWRIALEQSSPFPATSSGPYVPSRSQGALAVHSKGGDDHHSVLKRGQRTGIAGKYTENTFYLTRYIGTTVMLRPESRFVESRGIQQRKCQEPALFGMDVIYKF